MEFINKLNTIARVIDRAPGRIAVTAVNFSKQRFRQKNWVDRSRKPWPKRQRKDKGTLMVRSGRLKRSIRKIYVGKNYVIIGTDVPYAKAHNEGETIKKKVSIKEHQRQIKRGRNPRSIKVKSHNRNMNITFKPRRFLGESAVLGRRIEMMLYNDFKKILN